MITKVPTKIQMAIGLLDLEIAGLANGDNFVFYGSSTGELSSGFLTFRLKGKCCSVVGTASAS